MNEIERLLKPGKGKLLVISCLRESSQDSSTGGSDGYGGGQVKCFSCLKKDETKWKLLDYYEMKNPRTQPSPPQLSSSSSLSLSTLGPIAPQFIDICPTQYAIIQAVRSHDNSNMCDSNIDVSNIDDSNRDKAAVPSITTPPTREVAEEGNLTSSLTNTSMQFDRSEPSMVDYDDYYKGVLCESHIEEVEGHDAFLSFDVLSRVLHLETLNTNSAINTDDINCDDTDNTTNNSRTESNSTDIIVKSESECWFEGRGDFVVEVGCGSSAVGIGLRQLGYRYLGTDAIPSAIHVSSQRISISKQAKLNISIHVYLNTITDNTDIICF